jgi:hypothetical protein
MPYISVHFVLELHDGRALAPIPKRREPGSDIKAATVALAKSHAAPFSFYALRINSAGKPGLKQTINESGGNIGRSPCPLSGTCPDTGLWRLSMPV